MERVLQAAAAACFRVLLSGGVCTLEQAGAAAGCRCKVLLLEYGVRFGLDMLVQVCCFGVLVSEFCVCVRALELVESCWCLARRRCRMPMQCAKARCCCKVLSECFLQLLVALPLQRAAEGAG